MKKKRKISIIVIGLLIIFLWSGNIVSIGKAVAKDILRGAGREKTEKTVIVEEKLTTDGIPQNELIGINEYVQTISFTVEKPLNETVAIRLYKNIGDEQEELKLISGVLLEKGETEGILEAHIHFDNAIIRAESSEDKSMGDEDFYKEISIKEAVVNKDYQGPIEYTVKHFIEYCSIHASQIATRMFLIIGILLVLYCFFYKDTILKYKRWIVAVGFLIVEACVVFFVAKGIKKYQGISGYQGAIITVGVLLFLLFIGIVVLVYIRKESIHNIYCFSGFMLGVIFLIMMPVYTVPDEQTHLSTAYEVSNWMLGYSTNDDGTLKMREEDIEFAEIARGYTLETLDQYYRSIFTMADKKDMVDTYRVGAKTWHFQYLFSAMGITLGRILGLGAVITFLLGRMCNLIFFVTSVRYAIKITPVGKNVMMAIALFPMTLQQTMSYSYDTWVISIAYLSVALTLKFAYDNENTIKRGEFIVLFLCLALAGMVKGHAYFAIIFLPSIIVLAKYKENKKLAKWCLIIMGLAIVIMPLAQSVHNHLYPAEVIVHEGYNNYIEWAGEEGFTIGELIAEPNVLFEVLRNTLAVYGLFYVQSMIGTTLGWFEIGYAPICENLFLVCLAFQAIPRKRNDCKIMISTTVICWAVALIEMACIFGGMLLAWSPKSSVIIRGVQGRYLIPGAMLMLVSLRGKRFAIGDKMDNALLFLQLFAIGIAVTSIFMRFPGI